MSMVTKTNMIPADTILGYGVFAEGNTTEGTTKALLAASKAKKKEWEQQKFAADALASEGGNPKLAVEYYNKAIEKAPDNLRFLKLVSEMPLNN